MLSVERYAKAVLLSRVSDPLVSRLKNLIVSTLKLDGVPTGVSPPGDDNIIFDATVDPATGHTVSAGGFGHPECDATATAEAGDLPVDHPVGP